MALSGFFLMFFLVQHLTINLISIFSPNDFNEVSHFMGTNPLVQFLLQPVLIFAVRANTQVRESIWNRESNRGTELMGKTFALIGYGFMGEALAKRLSGFGANVIAFDKYKKNFSSDLVKEVSLDEVFHSADYLSLHTPLSRDTIGLVDKEFISNFKKSFVFINSARGKSVILKDLVDSLSKFFNFIINPYLKTFTISTNFADNISHNVLCFIISISILFFANPFIYYTFIPW